MSLPLFFPHQKYVPSLPSAGAAPLHALCSQAGVPCKASGRWINRPVAIYFDKAHPNGYIWAEPQGGAVRIAVAHDYASSPQKMARYGLGAMAFALFDLVSRESIRGCEWSNIAPPRGRPHAAKPLSTKERQRIFRERKRAASSIA